MEDRPGLFDDAPRLSDTQSDELVAYRPVSTAAVLGAVLSLVSLLTLVTPWLSGLPLVALAFSCLGARAVHRNPETTTGLGLARFGIAVSLIAGGAAFARERYAQHLYAQQAEPVATRFLELVAAGDGVGAVELTLPLDQRRPSEAAAKVFYEADEKAAERLEEFRDKPGVAGLLGSGSTPALVSQSGAQRMSGGALFSTRSYALPVQPGQTPQLLTLQLERTRPTRGGDPPAWRVADFRSMPRVD